MSGFEGATPKFMLDLQAQQRAHRAARDIAIREAADLERIKLTRLKASGVIPDNDLLFRNLDATTTAATTVSTTTTTATVTAPDGAMTRGEVFAKLRAGASPDGLDERFVADYNNSREALGWR